MKLIGTHTSPYARKVRIVLAEKRIDYDFVVDFPRDAATLTTQFNPLGKIPVLVLDDNTTVFDSRVIVEYLDSVSPVGRVIPDEPRQRTQVREALADGCSDAAGAIVIEKRRPAEK
jgi:glutathione S-transferase